MATDESSERGTGHVFISHHSSQYEAAKRVKAALGEIGIRGWLAPDDIDPGAAFDQQILAGIRDARAMVLLLCAESDRSRHVKREVMLADDAGTPVFPVRLEPVKAEGLAYWLKDQQWIDWFDGRGDALDRLVAALGDQSGESPRPVPPTSPSLYRALLAGLAVVVGLAGAGLAAWWPSPEPGPQPFVRSGLWLNKREMVAITYPQITQEATEQIRAQVENDPNPEECIADAVARQPDVNLFDPGNKGKCVLSGFQIGSGRLSGYLNCPMIGVKNGMVTMVFRGTYTNTEIVMDSDVTMAQPVGTLKFKARDSSHWVAEKCPADNR